ncbi:MAG: hypothetical protein DRJ35_06930 [Thermoprotei archaeon]|nr:MAG: hypothetical protein DRJ35_06930 [Thermoprotei archaeon]
MGILDSIRNMVSNRIREVVWLASGRSRPLTGGSGEYLNKIETIERILAVDSVTEGIIRKYIIDVCSGDIEVEGDDKSAKFLRKSELLAKVNRIKPFLVSDFFIYGNAYLEIVKRPSGRIDDIKYLRAKDVRPEEKTIGVLDIDQWGNIKGWRWKPENWYRISESLTLRESLDERNKGRYLPQDRVVHIRNLSATGNPLGDSLVLKMNRLAIIKGNIETALGETADRHVEGVWVAFLGDNMRPPSPKELEDTKERMIKSKRDKEDVLVFPYNTEFRIETGGDLSTYVKPLETLLKETYLALNYPYGIEEGRKLHASSPEMDYWDRNIEFYKKLILDQLIEQLFIPYMREHGYTMPKLVWKSRTLSNLLSKARRLGLYARSQLITPDERLEKHIRRIEHLPVE